VANLPEIVKDLVRILALEELRNVRILEGAGSGDGGHFSAAAAAPLLVSDPLWLSHR
jgi:hypothetical protein